MKKGKILKIYKSMYLFFYDNILPALHLSEQVKKSELINLYYYYLFFQNIERFFTWRISLFLFLFRFVTKTVKHAVQTKMYYIKPLNRIWFNLKLLSLIFKVSKKKNLKDINTNFKFFLLTPPHKFSLVNIRIRFYKNFLIKQIKCYFYYLKVYYW